MLDHRALPYPVQGGIFLKQYLLDYMQDHSVQNGLLIAQAPTGYGKSYQTVQAIYDYTHSCDYCEQVLFVTPLIKNLPVNDLKNAYIAHGNAAAFDHEVLLLKSNLSCVLDASLEDLVPPSFQTAAFTALVNGIRQWQALCKGTDPTLRQAAKVQEDHLRQKLEPAFRWEIHKLLRSAIPEGTDARYQAIEQDPRYQWIGKLYPAVFTRRAKVLFLTVKKLMKKNDPIAEPPYKFLSERMLKDRILCIDEFDATKKDILQSLIEDAEKQSSDYLDLFLQIHSQFQTHQFNHRLEQTHQSLDMRHRQTFACLQKRSEQIFQNNALFYSIKTAQTITASAHNFLFHDTSYHAVLHEGKTHIRCVKDDSRKQVVIHFDSKKEYLQHRHDHQISIHAMLRSIYRFLCDFQHYVQDWSRKYADSVNSERNHNADLYTLVQAQRTIYKEFGLRDEQIDMMLSEIGGTRYSSRHSSITIPNLSFYANGFQLFEFADDDQHQSKTELHYFQMSTTPENVMLFLASHARVIGLSATAALPTVTGNYDLSYLKDELGSCYQELPSGVQNRIRAELQVSWAPYRKGQIRIQTEIVDRNFSGLTAEDRLQTFLPKKMLHSCINQLENLTISPYYRNRYCNILYAFHTFWLYPEIRSFLCLNEALPQSGKAEFDFDFLKTQFIRMGKILAPDSEADLLVLQSGDSFESAKDHLLDRLGDGEKIFLFSSYNTLGAGQNLQHPIPKNLSLVALPSAHGPKDPRYLKKDIDALYLGDITNLIENRLGDAPFTRKELFAFCTKMESLYQNNEISADSLDILIKEGIRHMATPKLYNSASSLKSIQSIRRQATRDIVQAVGRICRTFQKPQVIHLLTTQAVVNSLDPLCLQGSTPCPEMQALLSLCPSPNEISPQKRLLNTAERIASQGNRYILQILANDWTPNSMQLWKDLRDLVLRIPCATKERWETDPIIHCYYIPAPAHKSSYLYAQKGDFSDIYLSDSEDINDLKRRCPDGYCMEVSAADARLEKILAYPGMQEYFCQQGWATAFYPCDYILSPVLFHNIYKGALGEVAGKFILEKQLGIFLTEIDDPACFELFDYKINDSVYVDFKHWKDGVHINRDQIRKKCRDKLRQLHGKKVYIINLFHTEGSASVCSSDGCIVEISGLLQEDNTLNPEAIELLRGELEC